eukprot:m.299295 g.299295  ORF g.299295 m.299295 type:complete len:521 (-) comp20108_c0_seq6:221-1783(-)
MSGSAAPIPTEAYADFVRRRKAADAQHEEDLQTGKERVMPIRGRLDDLDTDSYSTITMDTPIATDNIGHRMLMKMGWTLGTGLGSSGQGRLEPINITEKREKMGIGRMDMELGVAKETTEQRRLMESEMMETLDADKIVELEKKWKAQADRTNAIQSDLKEVNKVFYCDICRKQYTKVMEFDNHLSSYDHHHTKRLKELRERDRKQKGKKGGSGKKRQEKEQARELARINKLASARAVSQPSSATTATRAPPTTADNTVSKAADNASTGGWSTSMAPADTTLADTSAPPPLPSRPHGGWGQIPESPAVPPRPSTATIPSTTPVTATATEGDAVDPTHHPKATRLLGQNYPAFRPAGVERLSDLPTAHLPPVAPPPPPTSVFPSAAVAAVQHPPPPTSVVGSATCLTTASADKLEARRRKLAAWKSKTLPGGGGTATQANPSRPPPPATQHPNPVSSFVGFSTQTRPATLTLVQTNTRPTTAKRKPVASAFGESSEEEDEEKAEDNRNQVNKKHKSIWRPS